MQPDARTSFRPFLAATISLFILGWGLAALAIFTLTPMVWSRWLFFFSGTLGLISLALPVTWFLNLRFPSEPPAGPYVIVRQATWFGVYGALIAWLQQERLVSIWTGFGLALGLVAIEYLIRMRERARWQPAPVVQPEEPPAQPESPAQPAETEPSPISAPPPANEP
jgi:hypothetical protein